jgi:hypothetical protein
VELSEQELRALVRDTIARRFGLAEPRAFQARGLHSSQAVFPVARGSDGDGACLIEPAVRCSHCGYCQSLGH